MRHLGKYIYIYAFLLFLFAQDKIIAESIKSIQELPKIEVKHTNIAKNMWYANETIQYVIPAERK